MSSLKYSTLAVADIYEAISYLCEYSLQAANNFLDTLMQFEGQLKTFPKSCALTRDKRLAQSGYRVGIVGDYLVFYTIEESTVLIMRIIHCSRSYNNMF